MNRSQVLDLVYNVFDLARGVTDLDNERYQRLGYLQCKRQNFSNTHDNRDRVITIRTECHYVVMNGQVVHVARHRVVSTPAGCSVLSKQASNHLLLGCE